MFLFPTKPQRPELCLPGSCLTKPERREANCSQFDLCSTGGVRGARARARRFSLGPMEVFKIPGEVCKGLVGSVIALTSCGCVVFTVV